MRTAQGDGRLRRRLQFLTERVRSGSGTVQLACVWMLAEHGRSNCEGLGSDRRRGAASRLRSWRGRFSGPLRRRRNMVTAMEAVTIGPRRRRTISTDGARRRQTTIIRRGPGRITDLPAAITGRRPADRSRAEASCRAAPRSSRTVRISKRPAGCGAAAQIAHGSTSGHAAASATATAVSSASSGRDPGRATRLG